MSVRSLPHFSHSPIGKTTHKKGMTYAHVNYITRNEAASKTLTQNMPADRDGARPFFEREAYKEGVPANARIADTFIIALPLELTKEQRHEAIAAFMDKIGHGRIPWLAAFHDKGKDDANPHCHLIFRDADIDTGRKVVGTTTSSNDVREAEERGWKVPPRMTTKDLRTAWCEHLNAEMERHGYEARFDHRTLKQQGIDRKPEIHIGPKANSMAKKDREFESQDRRRGDHANVYSLLDTGSRAEHNERIREENRRREAGKQNGNAPNGSAPQGREGVEKRDLRERQAAERREMYQEQARDRAALRAAQDAQKLKHQRSGRALYAGAREKAFQEVKAQHAKRWERVRAIKNPERRDIAIEALKVRQKEAYRVSSDRHVEQVRPVKNEAWQTMKQIQEADRKALQQRHVEEAAALARQHIAERNALHERWRDRHLKTEANTISAKLETRQGMAAVQTSAVAMIKLNAKAKQSNVNGGAEKPAMAPLEASRHFAERGRAESVARTTIRYELLASRRMNEARAVEFARSPTRAARVATALASRPQPRQHATIQARRVAAQQANSQNAIRQAVGSGRSLTDAEKASASPDVKATISSKEGVSRRESRFLEFISQKSERGRNGGRSGR